MRGSVVGQSQNIVHACVVIPRELDKHLGRDIEVAAFVVAVNALTAAKNLRKLALFQVAVLAQIAYSFVICHINHHYILYFFIKRYLTFSAKTAIIIL